MEISLQIARPFAGQVEEEWLRRAAEATLLHQGCAEAALTVVIADDRTLQELNRLYLGHDAPTDVLAFPVGGGDERFISAPEDEAYLGDLLISYPQAATQAATFGHALRDELSLLVIHGVLHLLGHDDGDEQGRAAMWAIQDEILALLQRPCCKPIGGNS
jgi:probable rRNA maturation factor